MIIADLKDDACQGRVAELAQCGVRGGACAVNVTQRASIENLLAGTLQQTGRADILVNCAGVQRGHRLFGRDRCRLGPHHGDQPPRCFSPARFSAGR